MIVRMVGGQPSDLRTETTNLGTVDRPGGQEELQASYKRRSLASDGQSSLCPDMETIGLGTCSPVQGHDTEAPMGTVLLTVSVVLTIAILVAGYAAAREQGRVRALPAASGPLSPYELAYLAGGPRRVVNTALGVLAKEGTVRVRRGGHLNAAGRPGRVLDPVEQEILTLVSACPGTPASTVRYDIGNGDVLDDLEEQLMTRGLLIADGSMVVAARRLRLLRALAWTALTLLSILLIAMILGILSWDAWSTIALAVLSLNILIAFGRHRADRRRLRSALSTAAHTELDTARQDRKSVV